MKSSRKLLTAAAAILAAGASGAIAMAQQGPGFGPGRMGTGHGIGMMQGMMGHGPRGHGPATGTFGVPAARLGTIKTELGIKPEQTAAWEAYAKVVTDTATEMKDHREHVDRDAVHKMEPQQRREFAAGMHKRREESLSKVKAAAETLLTKLDDAQKTKAQTLLPGLVAAGPGPGMRHGMMGGPGSGQGMGPMRKH